MTTEYETMKNYIVELLDKSRNKIHNDDYLAIKRELDSMEKRYKNTCISLNKCRSENEKIAPYIEYVSKIKTAPLLEKLKFLFGGKKVGFGIAGKQSTHIGCPGCAEIYGQEAIIFRALRGKYEAFNLPETQKEWNKLYPELKKEVDGYLYELKRNWEKMLDEENKDIK